MSDRKPVMPAKNDSPAVAARSLALVRGLILAWVAVFVLGLITLQLPGALGARNAVSLDRAIFTAVNTSTLTGFSQTFANPEDFSAITQVVFATQILSAALLTLIGGGVLINRFMGTGYTDRQIAISGLVLIGFSLLIGLAGCAGGEAFWRCAMRGLTTLSGAGTNISRILQADSLVQTLLILPLGMVGAIGTVCLLDVYYWLTIRKPVSRYGLGVMSMSATVYLVGLILLLPLMGMQTKADVVRSNDLVLSVLGSGGTSQSIGQLARGVDWVLIAVTMAGIGTLSTGGGFSFAWVRTIPQYYLQAILVWIGIELFLMLVGLILLLQSSPALPTDRAVMLVVGGMMNMGISHGAVSLTGMGLFILSALMLTGRILPFWIMMGWIENRKRKI